VSLAAWVNLEVYNRFWMVVVHRYIKGTDGDHWTLGQLDSLLWGHIQSAAVTADRKFGLKHFVHVASTYDGVTLKIYQDGVEVGSEDVGMVIPTGLTEPVSIGCGINTENVRECIRATLDELVIYNRALSAGEVKALAAR